MSRAMRMEFLRSTTGKFYHVTLRLTYDQWDRAHQLARTEGVPLAHLAIRGLSKILVVLYR
jgi:hypothetical protein